MIVFLNVYYSFSHNQILFLTWISAHLIFLIILCPDKKGTPEEGRKIQRPKHCALTNNNTDEDNSLKNHSQNITHQTSSQTFR